MIGKLLFLEVGRYFGCVSISCSSVVSFALSLFFVSIFNETKPERQDKDFHRR